MLTRKGKAPDLLGSDETILWNSTRLSKGSSRRGCIHLYLLIAAPWALFVILIFASGMIPISPVTLLFFMLMMIPFWLYFFMLAYDKFDASHTFYYVTNKGIYIQKCAFPPETDFYSFDEFESAEPSENAMYVECRLKKPQIYYGKGKPRENWEILLEPESNRRDAAGIIQEQIKNCSSSAPQRILPFRCAPIFRQRRTSPAQQSLMRDRHSSPISSTSAAPSKTAVIFLMNPRLQIPPR